MEEGDSVSRKPSTLRAMRAVFWSFFGVRRNRDYQADVTQLTATQLVVTGIVGAVLFIATLLLLVYFVTR